MGMDTVRLLSVFPEKKIYQKLLPFIEEVAGRVKMKYGPELSSLVIFGSYARGEVTLGSDLDLLIILRTSEFSFRERLRDFYWDISSLVSGKYSLPLSPIILTKEEVTEFNPLYLEMWENHWVVEDNGGFLSLMDWITELVRDQMVQKRIIQGQTCWRIFDEKEIARRLPGALREKS